MNTITDIDPTYVFELAGAILAIWVCMFLGGRKAFR